MRNRKPILFFYLYTERLETDQHYTYKLFRPDPLVDMATSNRSDALVYPSVSTAAVCLRYV
ncbi:MAG: hypothetical protein LBL58_06275 [Tannerellaceae bacterium]|nr:hypothetical protein [Tannerellaceae bacterium]